MKSMNHRHLSLAFDKWQDEAMQRKEDRECLSCLLMRMTSELVTKMFWKWQETSEEMNRAQCQVRSAMKRMNHRHLSSAFDKWKCLVTMMLQQQLQKQFEAQLAVEIKETHESSSRVQAAIRGCHVRYENRHLVQQGMLNSVCILQALIKSWKRRSEVCIKQGACDILQSVMKGREVRKHVLHQLTDDSEECALVQEMIPNRNNRDHGNALSGHDAQDSTQGKETFPILDVKDNNQILVDHRPDVEDINVAPDDTCAWNQAELSAFVAMNENEKCLRLGKLTREERSAFAKSLAKADSIKNEDKVSCMALLSRKDQISCLSFMSLECRGLCLSSMTQDIAIESMMTMDIMEQAATLALPCIPFLLKAATLETMMLLKPENIAAVLGLMTTEDIELTLISLTEENRVALLVGMSPTDRVVLLQALSPEQELLCLSYMFIEDKLDSVTAMSAEHRATVIAAMPPEDRDKLTQTE